LAGHFAVGNGMQIFVDLMQAVKCAALKALAELGRATHKLHAKYCGGYYVAIGSIYCRFSRIWHCALTAARKYRNSQ
jgi:hypothetical protein